MMTFTNLCLLLRRTGLLLLIPILLAGCRGSDPTTDAEAGHDHDAPDFTAVSDSQAGAVLQNGGKQLYTCSMHPQVISEEPGQCPICGMDLTPIKQTASSEGVVSIDPVTIQNIGVRTAPVVIEPLKREVRTTGQFEMDERGAHTVSLKVSGWIEKLHANYEGAIVRQGQPLLEIYSPELVSTQEEYLLALRNARRLADGPAAEDARRLLEAARRRLAYWDLTEDQIRQLEESGQPMRTITFYATASGEVMNKMVVEGQQVRAGQPLMDVIDLSRIWLIADVYEQDLGWVKVGTPAVIELPYQAGERWRGRVEYMYHMLDREARTARARIVLPGGHGGPFKPGMYATVYLEGEEAAPAPTVPEESVIHSGEDTWVILALGGGRFQPQEVRTGIQAGGSVQVLDGLTGGELVVTSAQFLIDSEARLKSAIGNMAGHNNEDLAGGETAGGAISSNPIAASEPAEHDHKTMLVDVYAADTNGDGQVFFCVAEPHLLQDKPGKIPSCSGGAEAAKVGAVQSVLHEKGYTNVPVDPVRADANGDGFVYQSPMHFAVIEDAPGTCDLCNMPLEHRTVEEARQVLRRRGYVVR